MRRAWLACGVAALAVLSCGGEPAQQQEAKKAADCREAPSALKDALESSLRGVQNAELTGVRYVEVESPPDAPVSGFDDGMYVVSGLLQDRAADGEPLTFAANEDMVSTGGGLAFAIDPVTREFFHFGASAAADTLARDYIDAIREEPEYQQARKCAQQG
ncbi:MAG: hypothetical protein KY433_07830 [Actinobacteria bacterium]|nr:hypothetical protein [Actinomycetota bacterium]